jgi:nitroimidazol reductase NimA-like FMN-containing flavoprotein (pyridoxamine 5'-phosphate oxidase superfamily)
MRTELRRKERAKKTSREMELLLERMPVGRLAVTTEEGPYIIAVNYLFFEGSIHFHKGEWWALGGGRPANGQA